jgi:hypothetical protein
LDVVQIKGLLRKRKLNLSIGLALGDYLLSVHSSMLTLKGTSGKSITPSGGLSDLNGLAAG